MALNTFKCNYLTALHFNGLIEQLLQTVPGAYFYKVINCLLHCQIHCFLLLPQ